jgi:hypothetical protein
MLRVLVSLFAFTSVQAFDFNLVIDVCQSGRKLIFIEECSIEGKILNLKILHKEPMVKLVV